MNQEGWPQLFTLLLIFAVFAALYMRRRWRGSGTNFGTAAFATEHELSRAGYLHGNGLILARTESGRLITLPRYCHTLLLGGTGSGKGVSIIIVHLLTYFKGSCICFDTKGDLFATTAKHRSKQGQRIIDLAPFGNGKDAFNILTCVRPGSMLVDDARAIAEALVVRSGHEPEQHWNDSAVMVICGILVYVLLGTPDDERNLNSVREISSDTTLLDAVAEKLIQRQGIPARLGNHIKGLQDKEKSGVLSTVRRHLAFLDSELVAASVARTTFDVVDLCKPGTTLYLRIPPDQLEAQRGLLRCWLATLFRVVGKHGNESSEVYCLIDEASAAVGSLPALEEVLVRGRSSGLRLLLAYQSDSQVRLAYKNKPTLIYDNCDTHIYLCPPSGYETAELISKRLGEQTLQIENAGENYSHSWQTAGSGESGQANRSWSRNWAEQGRALMKPDEILTMNPDWLIAFVRGVNPILARRVKWYADAACGTAFRWPPPMWWLLFLACMGLIGWAAMLTWNY